MELTAPFVLAGAASAKTQPAVRRGFTTALALGAWAVFLASAASVEAGALGYGWHLLVCSFDLVVLMVAAHDAIHAAAHRSFKVNQAVGWLASVACGVPFTMLANNHLRHHRAVGTAADPERFCLGPWWQLPVRWPAMLAFYYVDTRARLSRRAQAQAAAFFGALVLAVAVFPALVALWLAPLAIAASLFACFTVWLPHGPFGDAVMTHLPGLTAWHDDHHARPAYPAHQYGQLHRWHVAQGTVTRKPEPAVAPLFDVAVAKAEALAGWIAGQGDAGRSFDLAAALERTALDIAGEAVFGAQAKKGFLSAARLSVKTGLPVKQVVARLEAGHDRAAGHALALLSKQPLVRARVEQELARVVGARALLPADVDALAYLGQVIHEVLRLHPIPGAPVPHRAWNNPQAFDPSRFAGDRRQTAAHLELTVVLATVLRRVRVDLRPGFVKRADNGLQVRAARRVA